MPKTIGPGAAEAKNISHHLRMCTCLTAFFLQSQRGAFRFEIHRVFNVILADFQGLDVAGDWCCHGCAFPDSAHLQLLMYFAGLSPFNTNWMHLDLQDDLLLQMRCLPQHVNWRRTCPLTPISIAELSEESGPAKANSLILCLKV